MNRIAWAEGGVEFHLSPGERIDLLRENGFQLERLIELYAPEGATKHEYYDTGDLTWARQWPVEEIWTARKTS
jgi:hypothetical protein